MKNLSLVVGLVLLVHGVFGVDEVKSVSVMVGDSLTLNSDFTETKGDELQWKFGESNIIAQIDREVNKISVPGNNEERFRGRLELDHQTGSLTITNIRTTDSGDYELKIKDSMNENNCRFIVTVRDVFSYEEDGVKTVSETKGDSVLLHTHVTHIQQNDPIEWTFGTQNIPVAKTDGISNSITYNYNDERFKNRLYLDIRTGDLTIKKSSAEHSGLYQLKIITSSYTIQKSFSVAVSGSGRSGAASGISGASVVLMVWAGTVFLLQEV